MSRNLHPSFQDKTVIYLRCKCCDRCICARGMKAILLADTKVELYSTDLPPEQSIQLIGQDYRTKNCFCRIKDVACFGCGCIVGYHVILPCSSCLGSCNNGHFWMFHSDVTYPVERLDPTGTQTLVFKKTNHKFETTSHMVQVALCQERKSCFGALYQVVQKIQK